MSTNNVALKNGWGRVRRWFKHHITILILGALLAAAVGGIVWQYTSGVEKSIKYKDMTAELDTTKKQLEQASAKLEETSADLEKTGASLSAANEQVKLLKETTAALTEQITGLKSENAGLEKQIAELLNVKPSTPKITQSQLKEQISSIGELATLKYIYTNASRKEGNLTWLWGWTLPFSDSSLLVTYDGMIKAGIDLKDITFAVNESSHVITVSMPKSRILDNNIPQETINVLEVKDGLFNPVTFADYNQFISEEKKVMENRAIDLGVLTDADKEAKATVEAFLKAIPGMDGYTLTFK